MIKPKQVLEKDPENKAGHARYPRRTREARKMYKRNSVGSTDSQQTCALSSVSSIAPADMLENKKDTVSHKFTYGYSTRELLSPGYLKTKLEANIKEMKDKSIEDKMCKRHNFIMTA